MSKFLRVSPPPAIALLLLFIFLSCTFGSPSSSAQYQRSALNYSGDLVILRLKTGNGTEYTVSQPAGTAFTVETGSSVATIIPTLNNGQLSLAINATSHPATRVKANLKSSAVNLFGNRSSFTLSDITFDVELIDIRRFAGPNRFLKPQGPGGLGDGQCCITCNGLKFCACAVSTACGNCCSYSCCG